ASLLILAFGGITNALIPLYAVGVFTSFTLSQFGMVLHHKRLKEEGWRWGMAVNLVGSIATAMVLIVVAVTKFAKRAWVPIVVVPCIITRFVAIKRHYDRVAEVLAISPEEVRPVPLNHTVVVLVGRIHKGVLKAVAYAKSLHPQHILAVYVSHEDEDRDEME